jgi:hypothetical protein
MSWRDCSDAEYCDADLYQLLYRDDGVVLGLVLRLRGGENTDAYVYAAAHDALRPTAKAITDRRKTGARMCVRIAVSCETPGQSRNIAQHPGHVPYLLLS